MILWIGGAITLAVIYGTIRWLTRKSAIEEASVFLKSRNRHYYRDWDEY